MKSRFRLYVLGACAASVSLAQNLYVPLLPQLQGDLQTSFYWVNMTVSLFTIALAVMQIVLGPLIDGKGRRAVLLPGMVLYAFASVACAFSGSVYMLLAFRVLQGIGAAAVPLVAATMIGDLLEGNERASGMATYQMILGIAPAVGPLIGGVIGIYFGYQGAFGFLSITAFVMLLVAAFTLPETKPAAAKTSAFRLEPYLRVMRSKTGTAVLLLGFMLYYMFYNFIVFLPEILTDAYQLDAKQIGAVFFMLMSACFIGSKISGNVQKRMGTVKSLMFTCSLALISLVTFILLAKLRLVLLLISLVLIGFTAGLTMSVPPTLLAGEFIQERATAIGVYNFVRYLGMAAAPIAGSLLYPRGGIIMMFSTTAVLLGAAVLFAKQRLAPRAMKQSSTTTV